MGGAPAAGPQPLDARALAPPEDPRDVTPTPQINRFDPKYASFGPRRGPLPQQPAPPLAAAPYPPPQDKYATIRAGGKHDKPRARRPPEPPQPLSAASLAPAPQPQRDYRSLQRPVRAATRERERHFSSSTRGPHTLERRPQRARHCADLEPNKDLYAVTEL